MAVMVVKFYVAVHNGVVVGSRSTARDYSHAAVYVGARGAFATFHLNAQAAANAARAQFTNVRERLVVATIETEGKVNVGATWSESLRRKVRPSVFDQQAELEEHAQRGEELLRGPWRDS